MNASAGPYLRTPPRRNALRRAVRVPCQVVAEAGFRLLADRTLDLSLAGMLVDTRGSYAALGEEVFVSFRAPRSHLWMDARATVTRLVKGRRAEDRAVGVGLVFTELDEIDRAVLRFKLQGTPPPVPARMPPVDYARTVRAIAGA